VHRAAILLLISSSAWGKITTGTAVPVIAGITEIIVNGDTIIHFGVHPVVDTKKGLKKAGAAFKPTPPPPPPKPFDAAPPQVKN
jgi:hypothetical protein